MTLEKGSILQNRYRILETLGQGGMGAIYRALDENLGVEVAVKENLFTTEEYARQFRREAVILANLRHPNLPRVSNHFVIAGQGQYLVMDYIVGDDLREWMEKDETVPELDVIMIGIALCEALSYMHSQDPPVLHRDIKPGNVRITPNKDIYLVDFGLAKISKADELTTTGARAMTPGYSPPEQYGGARTDPRSDIYSLGATLYAALTGMIPEDGLARTMDQAELTSIRERNPRVSRSTAAVVEKALAKHPRDRFQTADDFKSALLEAKNTGLLKRRSRPLDTDPKIVPRTASFPDEEASSPDNANPSPSPPFNPLLKKTTGEKQENKARGSGCWPMILLLIFLVVLAGGIFALLNPALSMRLLGMDGSTTQSTPTLPSEAARTANEPREGGELPGQLTGTVTHTLDQTQTRTPVPGFTLTLSPSLTPSWTISPTATLTLTPSPTALGGGYGQLAFVSRRSGVPQIWLTDVLGSSPVQITDLEEGACQPAWSPDGQKLVFVSPCQEHSRHYEDSHLYVIRVDGGGLEALPALQRGEYAPDWSPDGELIAFTAVQDDYRHQVYLLELSNQGVTKISNGEAWDFHPAWSPDGSQIAFISTRNGPYQVWLMNADGTDQHRFSRSRDRDNSYPDWNPEGDQLLYTQRSDGFPSLRWAPLAEEGFQEMSLYDGYLPMQEGKFSPDGSWVVFESWPNQEINHDIYIYSLVSGELRRLTSDPGDDYHPTWRPISN